MIQIRIFKISPGICYMNGELIGEVYVTLPDSPPSRRKAL